MSKSVEELNMEKQDHLSAATHAELDGDFALLEIKRQEQHVRDAARRQNYHVCAAQKIDAELVPLLQDGTREWRPA